MSSSSRSFSRTRPTRPWPRTRTRPSSSPANRSISIAGKTNTHELGIGVTGVNPHAGPVRNAHDPSRAGGGSSGGSAVAVALGLVHAALGSDAGGSTRIPAALNGVVGLKPTHGAWSQQGVFPLAPSLTQPGPITESPADAAALFAAVSGRPVGDLEPGDLRGLRVGVDEAWNDHAEDDIRRGTAATIQRLRALGAEIVPVTLHGLNEAGRTQMAQYVTELAETLGGELPAGSSPEAALTLALGRALTDEDRQQLGRLRHLITEDVNRAFESVDVILSPATGSRRGASYACGARAAEPSGPWRSAARVGACARAAARGVRTTSRHDFGR